jgi:hypothetical protein
MSEDYDGDDTAWIDHVRLVEDGEAASQAFLAIGNQDLADRTAYLRRVAVTQGAIPNSSQSVNADATIGNNVSYVEVTGGRAGFTTLTLPVGAPIGRRIKIVETGGEGTGQADTAHTILVLPGVGETLVSVSGADNSHICSAYDRMTLEKIGATKWIASVEPACTPTGAAGTVYDLHHERIVRVLPHVIGSAGNVTAGSENLAAYFPTVAADLIYNSDGPNIASAGAFGARPGFLLNADWISQQAVRLDAGAKLLSVTLTIHPNNTHSGLPVLMPMFGIRRFNALTATLESMRTTGDLVIDVSGSVAAYEVEHDLVFPCDENNRITPDYRYWIEFFSEGGTDAQSGLTIRSLTFNFGE